MTYPREKPIPTRAECVEALVVMIEAYGVRRVKEMLTDAQDILAKERLAAEQKEYGY